MLKAERSKLPKIKIRKRSGPRPKHLIVNDLRKGTGAPVSSDDAILVRYDSDRYGEALRRSQKTVGFGPTRFGMNEVIRGWKAGLPGMRVGGRRELVVPSRLGYQGYTLVYVIDLLALFPGGAGNF